MSRLPRRAFILASAFALVMTLPVTVSANHSWGGYHWARTSNPFTLKLGDNVSSVWDPFLATTSTDWSNSTVLNTSIVPGGSKSVKLCDATTGQVQVCDSRYGSNGWLGVASIWASGSHITKATVKLNDTYFSTASYNKPEWRNLVSCQEVGHTLGLDHQDVIFDNPNLGTCMDYTSNPLGPPDNQHPNQHDYDELVTIYTHLDSTTTVASTPAIAPAAGARAAGAPAADAAWGRLVQVTNHGHGAWYMQDLGAGNVILTHVFWAD